MEEVKIDNMVKFYALMLLYENNRHGYELIKNIGNRMEKKISSGQIYPFLKELKERKMIMSAKEGARDKTVYRLTSYGRKFVRKMLFKFSDMIRIAIKNDISQCMHCGCEIYKGSYKYKGKIYCCKSCAAVCR